MTKLKRAKRIARIERGNALHRRLFPEPERTPEQLARLSCGYGVHDMKYEQDAGGAWYSECQRPGCGAVYGGIHG